MTKIPWFAFRITILASIIFLCDTAIHAEFLTVNTLSDTDDSVCDAHCSLREAVAAANSGDTIIFAREIRGGTIQLRETIVIQKALNIDGSNRRRITLKGNGTFGILRLMGAGGAFRSVFIDGLIIRDGGGVEGGGIFVNPGVVLTIPIVISWRTTLEKGAVFASFRASSTFETARYPTIRATASAGPQQA